MSQTHSISLPAQSSVRKIPFEIQASPTFTKREQRCTAFMALQREAKQNSIQDISLNNINSKILETRYGGGGNVKKIKLKQPIKSDGTIPMSATDTIFQCYPLQFTPHCTERQVV